MPNYVDFNEINKYRRRKRQESFEREETDIDERLADGFDMIDGEDTDDDNWRLITNQKPYKVEE